MDAVLQSLLDKYIEIRRLRLGDDGGEPVQRMRSVASRWPGALREMDELPLDTIEARVAVLTGALQGDPVPDWAEPLAAYHGWMRACLAVKRAAGRDPSAATRWVRERYHAAADEPASEVLLEMAPNIARPPSGRLSRFVLAAVAARSALSVSACERIMFPPSPRRRQNRDA